MQHPAFPNPPIVEAIAALRFAPPNAWTNDARQKLRDDLGRIYQGEPREERRIELEATFAGLDTATTTKFGPGRVLLRKSDDSGLVGLGPGVLSVHVLKPYPGWDEFGRRIHEAAQVALKHTAATGLSQIALRYIDRIALPRGDIENLSEYFTAIPRCPDPMPNRLETFQCITKTRDPSTGTIAVLATVAVPPRSDESLVMLYDLHVLRMYESPLAPCDYPAVLDELHDLEYNIFMDSVTAKTRELFR